MKKIILVTGGNKGIGFEICRQLAELETEVILTARGQKKGNDAFEKLNQQVHFHPLDVTQKDSIAALMNWIKSEFGRLDVLINNAGIGVGNAHLKDAKIDEVKQIMETNFFGPMQLNSAALPLLQKSKDARIINVSSGMGALADLQGGYAGYRLSKSGLNAQTILLANELSDSNIKVNAMCPGWVRTDMGGEGAPRNVAQGADTAVWLSTEKTIPTGKFFRDRTEIDW